MGEPAPHLEVEAHVDASPAAVWAVVSDLRRTGEWSPECRKVIVWGRGPARLGSWLTGLNRRGAVVWPTLSRVHVYDEGRAIGWHTKDSGARWIYEVDEDADGAVVRERRELPDGMPALARFFAGRLLGGVDEHTDELHAGMRTSVERIKAAAEAATRER